MTYDSEYRKKYYQEHKEKWREYGRKWRELNPEKNKLKKEKYRATEKGKATERAYNKRYRLEHIEYIRFHEREYWANNKDKKAEKDKRYRETHKEELNRKSRERYSANKEFRKYHAIRTGVNLAVKKGQLQKKPCEVCGELKVEGHHDNYNEPYKVRWLCKKCHTEWHKHNKPIYLS